MSALILMRHGQASFDASTYDALSEAGLEQARASGAWLSRRGLSLTAAWHGPKQRHADTARHMLAVPATAIRSVVTSGLDEFAEGEELLDAAATLFGRPMRGPEGPSRREQLRCYDAAIEAWSRGRLEIPGRPDIQAFRRGVRRWLGGVVGAPAGGEGQQVLAVTSAGVVAAVTCEVLRLPDEQWLALLRVIHNASITEIMFSKGRCGLRTFNSIGHLPPELLSSI